MHWYPCFDSWPLQSFKSPRVKDESKVCHYCQNTGHCKDQCPVLRSKNKRKPFVFALAPTLSCVSIPSLNIECDGLMADKVFEPFVTAAVVSLDSGVAGRSCILIFFTCSRDR